MPVLRLALRLLDQRHNLWNRSAYPRADCPAILALQHFERCVSVGLSIAKSVSSARRMMHASLWLGERPTGAEVVIIGHTAEAANHLAREALTATGVAFGWHRLSWTQLAYAVAAPALAKRELVPIGRIGSDALVARLVQRLREEGRLGRYKHVSTTPGFPRAVGQVLEEMCLAGVAPEELVDVSPDLVPFLSEYEAELSAGGYCDRATVLGYARDAATRGAHRLLRMPMLMADVAIANSAELAFVTAVSLNTDCCVLVPSSDIAALRLLEGFGTTLDLDHDSRRDDRSSLKRLQRNLFRGDAEALGTSNEEVTVFSAPGEGREAAEIVRRILTMAKDGIAFDRMAVLLRSPSEYQSHLEEAFARAGVPAHFARGASRPDPNGRAFVALLKCAVQNLSANRFAEYLSLDQLPDPGEDGGPPIAADRDDTWTPPTSDDAGPELSAILEENGSAASAAGPAGTSAARRPRAPRRWERLLVEAAVVGGLDRWRRRIGGLRNRLRLELSQVELEEDGRSAISREIELLDGFASFALPLVEELSVLPRSAKWAQWLEALSALASRALRRPDGVLRVLAELAPLGEVGPVSLRQVLEVLEGLLLQSLDPPQGPRYGKVLVAPVDAVRGMAFDVVFVPGLAEKKFPRKIVEEPLLLDRMRVALGKGLLTNQTRLDHERLALALAVDAASKRIVLSYPRVDVESARSQVPSFYALEVVRSAEGTLPDFAQLTRRAEEDAASRLGWPAPDDPAAAIDDAEYDLSILGRMFGRSEGAAGEGRYLLETNAHLARALRSRYQRWSTIWTSADGLMRAEGSARASLETHMPGIRAYSTTALQTFAACPYKFVLRTIHGLAPVSSPSPLDEMDSLQRGSIVHEMQFSLLVRLRDGGLLPLGTGGLSRAQAMLDDVIEEVEKEYRDLLAPAIERVWDNEISAIRADLREWLRRMSIDTTGFVPSHFELSFGLPPRPSRRQPVSDASSTSEPVRLDSGLLLRGSIDLVERHPSGLVRLTDHKTGKAEAAQDQLIAGGRSLQPVLYALAAEKLFTGGEAVTGGRLYFATRKGGFAEIMVALDDDARLAAEQVTRTVEAAIRMPFLPAAPAPGECDRCDFRRICGPYEEQRAGRKPRSGIEPLERLRETR